MRSGHDAPAAGAALDHSGLRQLRERAIHRHAGTLVLPRQLVLDRDPAARTPLPRDDPTMEVAKDPGVKGATAHPTYHSNRAPARKVRPNTS